MGGGWFGYVVAMVGCGTIVLLLFGATAALYGWSRLRPGSEPRASVKRVGGEEDA